MKEPPEMSGQWELPGGGLDFGESPQACLAREIEEEMHLKVTNISDQPKYVWTSRFDHTRDMDWYYSLILVYGIELEGVNFTPTAECEAIAFYSADELQTLDLFHQSLELRKIFDPQEAHDYR